MKKYHATIMVVEDDSNDQFLIEEAFRKIGVTDLPGAGGGQHRKATAH
jgi:hypothetical protein